MNTHDIELPPLPEWADATLQGEDRASLFAWAEAAIEAYLLKKEDYINDDRDMLRAEIVALKGTIADLKAALQSQDREDAERYRYLIDKLQRGYDGDYFETDLMSLYCHMPSQFKGDRVVRAEITWRDKSDEPIGLSAAIDHARRVEGDGE